MDGCGHLVAGRPAPPVDELLLQGSKEALDDSVVPTITATAEAALDAVVLQGSLVVVTRVLRTTIGMLEQPRFGQSLTDGHGQCRKHDVGVHARLHRPAHHATREEVDD